MYRRQSNPSADLIDPATGRLDAARVAEYLSVSSTDVVALIDQSGQDIDLNAEAQRQETLRRIVIIIEGLLTLTGNRKRDALTWLKAPHPELDHYSPLALIQAGEIGIVADLVEDMLNGEPA